MRDEASFDNPADMLALDDYIDLLETKYLARPRNADGTPILPKKSKPTLEIHRLKGRLVLDSGKTKILQGVREIFEIVDAPHPSQQEDDAGAGSTKKNKIVFIGRHLNWDRLARSLGTALKGVEELPPPDKPKEFSDLI